MELVEFFKAQNVVGFILLFFRFGGLFISTPIFSHTSITATLKTAMAFFFTIVFYPVMPPLELNITIPTLFIAILSELFFGLLIGLMLQLAYNVITFAGGIISYMMGFSMASAIDPQSGISMPIISQFLSLMGLMVLFELDLHHWLLYYINSSLPAIPLGGFILKDELLNYFLQASANMFVVGLMISFPIISLSLLADIIFGMLMKTMPQFNLLVIGFPIKIMVSFAVLIATFSATMLLLKLQIKDAFNILESFF